MAGKLKWEGRTASSVLLVHSYQKFVQWFHENGDKRVVMIILKGIYRASYCLDTILLSPDCR
jgi:hypothetical protein